MAIYSHTRLAMFENCPRQYFYQYIAKVPVEKEEGIEAFLGSLVHESLEKLYRDVSYGRLPTPYELIRHFKTEWKKRFHEGIVIVKKEYTATDYREVGIRALDKYHARHAPFNQAVTLALEERVLVNLDSSGQRRLQGYLDRVAKRQDGVLEIHDYKTNAKLPTQAEKDNDRQLALYQLGIENRWTDIRKVELVWHFLRFDEEIRSQRDKQQLDDLRRETITLIDDVQGRGKDESAFEPRESKLCDWCSFQHVCPVRKHRFKTAELPANEFLKEPGVNLVNEWATIRKDIAEHKDAITDLAEKEQKIIDAIIELAQRETLTVINGSDHEVVIASKTSAQLPTKGNEPEAYAELERRLRSSKIWPTISIMDVPRLRRIWNGEEEDPGQARSMLQPFVNAVTEIQARLRKRKE